MRQAKALTGLIVALFFSSCESGPVSKPNIILISIDCLNHRQFETALAEDYAPGLEALAEESISFSRAYSHAPWTTPSHMSLLTGLYPSQHGRDVPYGLMIQWNEFYSRVPNFETLGDRLAREGYETAAFVGQGSISAPFGLDQGFDIFEEHRKIGKQWTDLPLSLASTEEWLAARDDGPFFLFFHTYDLHGPRPTGLESDRGSIHYIDQHVSRLIVELKARELYDNSLIILTGDHGSEMIETDGKCCVHGVGHYDENLRVPLLLKLPEASEVGQRDTLARHIDVFPTVLQVAGVENDYEGLGVSLLQRERPELVSYSEADGRCAKRRAIVTERYKYIYTVRGETQVLLQNNELFFDDTCPALCRDVADEELYDLRKDPFEKTNVVTDQGRADELHRLRREMALHLNLPKRYLEGVLTEAGPEIDEELRRALMDLGYITVN